MMFKPLSLVYLTLLKLDKKAAVFNVAHSTSHFNSVDQYRVEEIRARSLHIVVHCFKKMKLKLLHNARMHKSRTTTFCTVVPSPCGSSVWSFLHVALLASRILGLFINCWKICGPSIYVCPETHNLLDIPTGAELSSF